MRGGEGGGKFSLQLLRSIRFTLLGKVSVNYVNFLGNSQSSTTRLRVGITSSDVNSQPLRCSGEIALGILSDVGLALVRLCRVQPFGFILRPYCSLEPEARGTGTRRWAPSVR